MTMPKTPELQGIDGPGVGPVRIKALDNLIYKWRDYVSQRMALGEKEVEARTAVAEMMKEKGVTCYMWSDSDDTKKLVRLTTQEKVKLEKNKDATDEDQEQD